MERKIEVDLVLLQFEYAADEKIEALAMKNGAIIDFGSIPYIFSTYKGHSLFHGQGNPILFFELNDYEVRVNNVAKIETGCRHPFGILAPSQDKADRSHVIAYWRNGLLEHEDKSLLDEHWDDH